MLVVETSGGKTLEFTGRHKTRHRTREAVENTTAFGVSFPSRLH